MTAASLEAGEASDAQLIRRSCEDPEWFAVLFDRHGRQIHHYVACRLGTHAAETFLIAFRRRESYDQSYRQALPWLYGIATTLIARHQRGEQRFLRALQRTGVKPLPESVAEQVVSRVAAQEQERHLAAALASLSRKDRDVLLLVALGDLSYEETAQALSIPIGTARSRLHRARRKVREALGGTDPITGLTKA